MHSPSTCDIRVRPKTNPKSKEKHPTNYLKSFFPNVCLLRQDMFRCGARHNKSRTPTGTNEPKNTPRKKGTIIYI